MRDALPKASFVGFTGTPIELTDANTRQTGLCAIACAIGPARRGICTEATMSNEPRFEFTESREKPQDATPGHEG